MFGGRAPQVLPWVLGPGLGSCCPRGWGLLCARAGAGREGQHPELGLGLGPSPARLELICHCWELYVPDRLGAVLLDFPLLLIFYQFVWFCSQQRQLHGKEKKWSVYF